MQTLSEWVALANNQQLSTVAGKIRQSMLKKGRSKSWASNGEVMTEQEIIAMLKSSERCAFTGVPLYPSAMFGREFERSTQEGNWMKSALSWDRLDPSRNYTADNTVLCTMHFNKLKGSLSMAELQVTLESIKKLINA